MKSVLLRFMTVVMAIGLIAPFAGDTYAQRPSRNSSDAANSAALVSGAYRVEVQQTVVVEDPTSVGLDNVTSESVVVAITDITNVGAATVFDPAVVTVGQVENSPLELASGTPADPTATTNASVHLKLSIDGNFAVAENSTIRVALVFLLTDELAAENLALRVGDQVMSIETTVHDSVNLDSVPALQATMTLRIADITAVPGSNKVSVAFRDGGSEDITLTAIKTPKQNATGSAGVPGCFYNETSDAINSMSGGTVWLESDPSGEGYLAWINNASLGTFDLLNGRLVQEGFAGVNDKSQSPYTSWLSAATEWARSQQTGLWNTCKSAGGIWIDEPTPAPQPTKTPDEVRAEYQWIDARDLLIRPGNFDGTKIALQGTVFNIEVEGNLTVIQMWVSGGNYDNVIVAYQGDSTGIYEGTWITVYGVGDGTITGTNGFGAKITVPIVRATIVDW